MSMAGMMTFACADPLDFTDVTGLKAYIASGFSPSTGELTLTRVQKVPAGEGLLLKGEPGETYELNVTETDMYYSNLLHGLTTATTVAPTSDGYTNFILANGSKGVGFYAIESEGELAAGKAYLSIPTSVVGSASEVKMLFSDEEVATGVNPMTARELNSSSIFDLQGRRVASPSRGLYIVNGKKVVFNK